MLPQFPEICALFLNMNEKFLCNHIEYKWTFLKKELEIYKYGEKKSQTTTSKIQIDQLKITLITWKLWKMTSHHTNIVNKVTGGGVEQKWGKKWSSPT